MNTRNIQVDRKTDGTHIKKISYENQEPGRIRGKKGKKKTKHDP